MSEVEHNDRFIIQTGEMTFHASNKSIAGVAIEGSGFWFLGYYIQRRIIPKLDDDFEPTNETYEKWELRCCNESWYYRTIYEAEMKAIDLYRINGGLS